MKIKIDTKVAVVIIAFLLIAGSVWSFKLFKSTMIAKFVAKAMPAQTTVTVETVKEVFWAPDIKTVGSVRAEQSVDIAPEVPGRVTKILFSSGQLVKAGELLVQLNPDVLTAQLESAKAKHTFTALTYERQLELLKRNVGQQQSVDSAKAEMDEAQAMVDQIQAQLDQLAIKAPFSGVLGLRFVNVGQYVSPGNLLVNLQSVNPMEVDFTVPEVLLNKIAVGLPVTVKSLAYPDALFKGEIFAVNSQVNTGSRALAIRATVDNESGYLVPEMFADVTIHLNGGKNLIAIPQIALNYSQIGDYVYLAENGKAVRHYVTVGERRGDTVSIVKGLTVGDTIVTTGQLKLNDGSLIKVLSDSLTHKEENNDV